MNAPALVVALLLAGCTCNAASEGTAPIEPEHDNAVTSATALLTGHTGLGGWSLAADGSTLFFSTERYDGGPTHVVAYQLDLTSDASSPVRVEDASGPLSFDRGSASGDGSLVLIGRADGLHRIAPDGSGDIAFPESMNRGSAFLSPSGNHAVYVWQNTMHVMDFARNETHEIPFESDGDIWLLGFADDASLFVKIDATIVGVTLLGARTERCTDCGYDHVGGNARLTHRGDGAYVLITPEGERSLPEALVHALSPSGNVLAHITVVEAPEYEFTKHLLVEGLATPVDTVLPGSFYDFGAPVVADDGTVVAELAIREGDALQSCLAVLHPSVRIVACEPCDSTVDHCR